MSDKSIDVRYVAELARLALTDEEVTQFQPQLESILKYVEQLSEVNVDDVVATAHTTPVFNVFREDVVLESLDKEAALANAPLSANGLVIVTKVIE
ncbi:MAG: Asp-tRNA(Asn)/Glu-tRNA(Gln) amidotransferase subunit GatC [Chthoniobacterales bacterium]